MEAVVTILLVCLNLTDRLRLESSWVKKPAGNLRVMIYTNVIEESRTVPWFIQTIFPGPDRFIGLHEYPDSSYIAVCKYNALISAAEAA